MKKIGVANRARCLVVIARKQPLSARCDRNLATGIQRGPSSGAVLATPLRRQQHPVHRFIVASLKKPVFPTGHARKVQLAYCALCVFLVTFAVALNALLAMEESLAPQLRFFRPFCLLFLFFFISVAKEYASAVVGMASCGGTSCVSLPLMFLSCKSTAHCLP